MGDQLDKVMMNFSNICPIHNIAYSGVCGEKNCYRTGLICYKCTPETCIETLHHKRLTIQEFFNTHIKHLVMILDFNKLNELIKQGLEVQKKDLNEQINTFEKWEINLINDKLEKFKDKMIQKVKNFRSRINKQIQEINEEYLKSCQDKELFSSDLPDFRLDDTIKFINDNKENKDELEKFLGMIKKYMDQDKLQQTQTNLQNIIYCKYLCDHLQNSNCLNLINALQTTIEETSKNLIKSIYVKKEYSIFSNQKSIEFQSNPLDLRYKETLSSKCLKSYSIDSIFDVFIALDGNCYLASSIVNTYDIEILNLKTNSVASILKGHTSQLYIIRHFCHLSQNKDYILSTSNSKSVKVWNLATFQLCLNINNCHTGSYLYSALLLFDEAKQQNYVVTSCPNEYMKVWNFDNGNYIKDIGGTSDYTYYINSWYHNDNYYIINANSDNVKIYGMENTKQLFGEYAGAQRTWHMSAFVEKINGVEYLFESDGNGYIRMWNVETTKLYKSINCPGCNLRGLCLWNHNFIIGASSDKSFKIVKIDEERVITMAGQHNNSVCSVMKIKHPNYGECLLSGSVDGCIKLWANKNN